MKLKAASSEFEAGEVEVQIAGVASRYHKGAKYSLEIQFRDTVEKNF